MFLRFAVAFLEYSENLRLIRGEKKRGVPENKKHQSETVFCWNKIQVKYPENSFHQFLYFQSLSLQTCEYCKRRASSYDDNKPATESQTGRARVSWTRQRKQ